MNCAMCGHANPDGGKFCRACGGSLAKAPPAPEGWACARCHHTNRDSTRFCASCGMPAGGAPLSPSSALDAAAAASSTQPVNPPQPSDEGPTATQYDDSVSPICSHCGALHQPGARFCKACGQSVQSPAGNEHPVPPFVAAPASGSATPVHEPTLARSPTPSAAEADVPPASPMHAEHPAAPGSIPTQAASAPPTAAPSDGKPRSGSGKTIAIASAIVVLVAGIGTVVAWKLPQRNNIVTEANSPIGPASSGGTLAQATPPSAPSASGAAIASTAAAGEPEAVAPVTADVAHAMTPPTSKQTEPAIAPAPAASTMALATPPPAPIREGAPAPRKAQAAPTSSVGPSMQQVALKLVRQGEQAFDEQNYSTAIANANAALEMQPGDARASRLLREAQQAQQNAMNSISIH